MNYVNYVNLCELVTNNPDHIEIIKFQYINLLSELTNTVPIDNSLFINNLNKINQIGIIYIGLIGTVANNDFKIVGSGTIIIEPKIIHGGKNTGHIEDIVVDPNYRSKGISQNILNKLKEYAINNNCYKIILDCDSSVKQVYIKNGFDIKGLQMALYI